jgi:hypothetical protein
MKRRAQIFASSNPSLDFSVKSVAYIQRRLEEDNIDIIPDAAAYIGEVLLRSTEGGQWALLPQPAAFRNRLEPSVRWTNGAYHCPVESLRFLAKHIIDKAPLDYLEKSLSDKITWLGDPTPERAKTLGWKFKMLKRSRRW